MKDTATSATSSISTNFWNRRSLLNSHSLCTNLEWGEELGALQQEISGKGLCLKEKWEVLGRKKKIKGMKVVTQDGLVTGQSNRLLNKNLQAISYVSEKGYRSSQRVRGCQLTWDPAERSEAVSSWLSSRGREGAWRTGRAEGGEKEEWMRIPLSTSQCYIMGLLCSQTYSDPCHVPLVGLSPKFTLLFLLNPQNQTCCFGQANSYRTVLL